MDKLFLEKGIMSKLLSILLFLLMFASIILPSINIAQGKISERLELIVTIEPPSNISLGSTIEQLNFTTNYDISKYFVFPETKNYSFPEGVLMWSIEGLPTENVSIYDNLGNTFSPIIDSTMITSPPIENITLQASFNYKLTLSFQNIGDVAYDNSRKSYGHYIGVHNTDLPATVDIRLPEGYSVNGYSEGCTIFSEQQYTVLRWSKTQNESLDCLVYFMPFMIEPAVRSMAFTIEALTPSPSSLLRETFSMTYDLIGTVMIWNVSLVMPISVRFPNNMSGTEVESVYDGQGICELRTTPIDTESDSPLGKYYVDNKNKLVKIYPRNSYQDETQKFDVKITFVVPNNSSDDPEDPHIPFWQPYRGFIKFTFNSSDFVIPLNLTGNFKVTFVFPSEVDPISSIDEDPISFGKSEDGRTTAVFNYNSPINPPEENWGVLFDNISHRDFYNNQVFSILALSVSVAILSIVILLVSKTVFLKTSIGDVEKILKALGLVAVLGLVGTNFKDLLILGWFDWWVVTCVITQFLLSAIVIFLMFVFFRKRKETLSKEF